MGFVKTIVPTARADVGIGPYGMLRVCIGAYEFVMLYCAGGVEPLPYVYVGRFYGFTSVHTNLQNRSVREGQAPPLHYD